MLVLDNQGEIEEQAYGRAWGCGCDCASGFESCRSSSSEDVEDGVFARWTMVDVVCGYIYVGKWRFVILLGEETAE